MRFSYQKRAPFPIERYFGTRNDPARTRLGGRRLRVKVTVCRWPGERPESRTPAATRAIDECEGLPP
jgi:hypothetical protein